MDCRRLFEAAYSCSCKTHFHLTGCLLLENHGLRRRLAEDSQPYQRWACERTVQGRAACPQAAAGRLLARFSKNPFWKTLHASLREGWAAGEDTGRGARRRTWKFGLREHAGQICGELRGFVHGAPGFAFDGRQGEVGLVENAHGHVELTFFDPGVGSHGGLTAGAEDL